MATKVTMNLFEAKKQYPDLYLLKFEDDDVVIFHLLKWKDFKAYRSILQYRPDLECDAMENIFRECVLDMAFPFTTTENNTIVFEDVIPAGVIDAVSHSIYELSGSNDPDKLFQDIEQSRNTVYTNIEERIISTIGTVTKQSIADYNNMYWPDILSQISQNETLMSGDVPDLPFVKGDPEEHKQIDFKKENQEEGSDLMSVEEGFEARREDTRRRKRESMTR